MYTACARKLFDVVVTKFSENEEALMRLEKAINPLLDDNDQVAFTYVINKVLNDTIKSMQARFNFHHFYQSFLVRWFEEEMHF